MTKNDKAFCIKFIEWIYTQQYTRVSKGKWTDGQIIMSTETLYDRFIKYKKK